MIEFGQKFNRTFIGSAAGSETGRTNITVYKIRYHNASSRNRLRMSDNFLYTSGELPESVSRQK